MIFSRQRMSIRYLHRIRYHNVAHPCIGHTDCAHNNRAAFVPAVYLPPSALEELGKRKRYRIFLANLCVLWRCAREQGDGRKELRMRLRLRLTTCV